MKSTSTVAAFLLVLAVGAAAASAGTGVGLWTSYVVPRAAHLPGDAGTFWRTDVAVVNPYPYQAVTVRVAYLPEKTDNSSWPFRAYTLGPGAQLVLDDVVGSVFGQEGKGSLCVWSPDGLYFTVSARTYTGAAGTFGQTVNGQQSVNFGEAQSYTAGVRNAAGYRTNVGVFNWSAAALEVRADVFDDAGVLAGSRTFSLKPWSSEQVGVGTFAGNAASGYVRWTGLTAGDGAQWLAYASVVDDTTGDAVFVEDRSDDVYTQHEPAYDLSGRWYGNVSTALGGAPATTACRQ